VRELVSNLRRLGRILHVVGRHLLAGWWQEGRRWGGGPRRPALGGPERLRVALEEIGGTFIKLGQMLALQPDILPLEYCNALFKLLDRVEPFPYSEVERIVVEDLGRPPEEIFDSFETASFAAASIGQVRLATLGGRRLAG
jgi:ubiquinone biosynthesis protein